MKEFNIADAIKYTKNNKNFDNVSPSFIAENSDTIMRKVNLAKELVFLVLNIKILVNMVKAYCNKTYTRVPKKTIIAISFALFYVVSPIDAIPDNTPVIGYVDDIAVVEHVLKSANQDIEDYKKWEDQQRCAA